MAKNIPIPISYTESMPITLIKQHRYELIAFMTGAAVMVLEIVGARLIAPYFGTSTYVWTAMIGVILGSLAIGYALGGRMADKDEPQKSLAGLIIFAAMLVLVLGLVQGSVLTWLAEFELDLRLSTLLAAVLLFAAPSLLIGMVSPHLAKIRITSLASSGKSVGRLEAAGALGSIAGTFLCGYFLLGAFGSKTIVFGVVGALLITSLLALPRGLLKLRAGTLTLAVIIGASLQLPAGVLADVDTSYARYQVKDYSYGGSAITALLTDNRGVQSGVSKSSPDTLVFPYIQQFNTALRAKPDTKSILVIGGGTFTFPEAAARENPNLRVDVVEIDPRLTDLSKEFFDFEPTSNLRIINQDGRTYLNRSDQKYDMIFMDAYNAVSPPFQVTTQEALKEARRLLQPGGVLVSNVLGRSDVQNDPYLQAMQATTASVFNAVELHPTFDGVLAGTFINHIMVASNTKANARVIGDALQTKPYGFLSDGMILRDDYAPIEQLINQSGN